MRTPSSACPPSRGPVPRRRAKLQTTEPRRSARFLSRSFRAIAGSAPTPATRVDRAYWYTWASVYCCEQFRFSGLLRYDDEDGAVKAMPALRTLRSTIGALRGPQPAAARRVATTAAARRKVPFGFVGTVADGPLFEPWVDLPGEVNAMVGAGVRDRAHRFQLGAGSAVRELQRRPPRSALELQGRGRRAHRLLGDRPVVTAAAQRRLAILPVVLVAPRGTRATQGDFDSPPKDLKAYARFIGALARRYGPTGTFWTEHPELREATGPLLADLERADLKPFWSDQPFAKDYVKLLRLSRSAIRGADPTAKIVLAGLPNKSWIALAQIYKAVAAGYSTWPRSIRSRTRSTA